MELMESVVTISPTASQKKKVTQNLVAILVMVMLMEHLFTQDLNQHFVS
jgi:hypothetical protein